MGKEQLIIINIMSFMTYEATTRVELRAREIVRNADKHMSDNSLFSIKCVDQDVVGMCEAENLLIKANLQRLSSTKLSHAAWQLGRASPRIISRRKSL